MKKPIVSTILTVFFSMSFMLSFAQTFGLKAGYNISTYTFDESALIYGLTMHKQPGFHVGLNFSVDFSKNVSLETLLSLNSKGIQSKYVDPKEKADYKTTTKLYYIDLPVSLKYKVPIGNFNVFAMGGGYIGSGLYGTRKFKDNSEVATPSSTSLREFESPVIFNSKEKETATKRLDYGFVYGAGVEYKLFSISAQHMLGMADLYKEASNQHRVFQISLGYTFRHQAFK